VEKFAIGHDGSLPFIGIADAREVGQHYFLLEVFERLSNKKTKSRKNKRTLY
jgi:hypothetical protein